MKRVDLQFIRKPSGDQISFAPFDEVEFELYRGRNNIFEFCAITFAEVETDNGDKIVNE